MMNETTSITSDLIYKLNDQPPLAETLFAALQHLLAIFVPIMTPALIISSALSYSVLP
jgi:xanthine permease XanP